MSGSQLLTGFVVGDILLGIVAIVGGILYSKRPFILKSRSFKRLSAQHADRDLLRAWRWFLVRAIGPLIALGGLVRVVNALTVGFGG